MAKSLKLSIPTVTVALNPVRIGVVEEITEGDETVFSLTLGILIS
jgi:hypothetical protein